MQEIFDRACWNWALTGSTEGNDQRDTSPLRLYEQNAPINPFTGAARINFPINSITEPNLGQLWNAAKAVGANDANRIAFMTAMARYAARANGLRPAAASPYEIHVTAPRNDWYHWQHWALAINHAGRRIFIQTEPNSPLSWGYTRIWEANRPGYLAASFPVQEILQPHKDVIEVFLSMPMCVGCRKVKPPQTGFNSRWHECTGAANHHHCGACGYRLPWNGRFSRTRLCNQAPCNAATRLMGDP